MNDYTGRHVHTLDDKGRVSVPAQFRKQLPTEGLFLGKGMEGSLILYPPEKWEKVRQGLMELSRNSRRHRDIIREVSQFIKPVSIDAQGRISIPADLLEISGITHDVVFLGFLDAIEVWSRERYEGIEQSRGVPIEDSLADIEFEIY
jgi:MraZ protein